MKTTGPRRIYGPNSVEEWKKEFPEINFTRSSPEKPQEFLIYKNQLAGRSG